MTPVQERTVAAFRSEHRIEPVRDWEDDLRSYVLRCRTDHLRVYQVRDGSFRHDVSDVRRWESGNEVGA